MAARLPFAIVRILQEGYLQSVDSATGRAHTPAGANCTKTRRETAEQAGRAAMRNMFGSASHNSLFDFCRRENGNLQIKANKVPADLAPETQSASVVACGIEKKI